MMRARPLVLVAALAVGPGACSNDVENPFDQFSFSRAPSEDAVLMYVSGAWAEQPGFPREVYAVNADGSAVERLTSCTQRDNPCDFLQVSPSPNRERIIAVRGAVAGDPEASALFFVDLGRSVETVIAAARRVQAADWAFDERFIIYSTEVDAVENLFLVEPNGEGNQVLFPRLQGEDEDPPPPRRR